ncbi:hypothetical protein ABES02_28210 [Neobacillus pocheonensis]
MELLKAGLENGVFSEKFKENLKNILIKSYTNWRTVFERDCIE